NTPCTVASDFAGGSLLAGGSLFVAASTLGASSVFVLSSVFGLSSGGGVEFTLGSFAAVAFSATVGVTKGGALCPRACSPSQPRQNMMKRRMMIFISCGLTMTAKVRNAIV